LFVVAQVHAAPPASDGAHVASVPRPIDTQYASPPLSTTPSQSLSIPSQISTPPFVFAHVQIFTPLTSGAHVHVCGHPATPPSPHWTVQTPAGKQMPEAHAAPDEHVLPTFEPPGTQNPPVHVSCGPHAGMPVVSQQT